MKKIIVHRFNGFFGFEGLTMFFFFHTRWLNIDDIMPEITSVV